MTEFALPPVVMMDHAGRAQMTVSCRDADAIPKVADAGEVVTFGGKRVQIMHNGVKVVAGGYHGDWMMTIIRELRGHHEPQEEVVFHELMKHIPQRATMIELGGNWSYYSLWFLQDFPDRASIVLEPDPNFMALGQENAELNDRQIQFIQGSVGDACRPRAGFETETAGVVVIPQITVAEIMRQAGWETLDVLHCDTQGAETAVIRSCEQLLTSRRIRFGVFSTHSHHISGDPLTHQRCLQMLKDFGGRILAEHDVHESFSGDGLIAAYFGETDIAWSAKPLSYNRYSTSLFRNPLFDLADRPGPA